MIECTYLNDIIPENSFQGCCSLQIELTCADTDTDINDGHSFTLLAILFQY
jgi:hypothetical protein